LEKWEAWSFVSAPQLGFLKRSSKSETSDSDTKQVLMPEEPCNQSL
jgi:hypothetical protein